MKRSARELREEAARLFAGGEEALQRVRALPVGPLSDELERVLRTCEATFEDARQTSPPTNLSLSALHCLQDAAELLTEAHERSDRGLLFEAMYACGFAAGELEASSIQSDLRKGERPRARRGANVILREAGERGLIGPGALARAMTAAGRRTDERTVRELLNEVRDLISRLVRVEGFTRAEHVVARLAYEWGLEVSAGLVLLLAGEEERIKLSSPPSG